MLDADCEELYYIVKYGGMSIDMEEFWPERVGIRVMIGDNQNEAHTIALAPPEMDP